MSRPIPLYETNAKQLHFLVWSVWVSLIFITVVWVDLFHFLYSSKYSRVLIPIYIVKISTVGLMPYPCSLFYPDIKPVTKIYCINNMEAIPKFYIKSDIKFDISTKLTTWIGHKALLL